MSADPRTEYPHDTGTLTDRLFWNRHANPRSVWWFVGCYPVLVLALYRRSPRLLGAVLGAVAVNLLVVSPPETDDAWATRVVRGEQVWLERGLRSSRPDLGLLGLGAAVQLYTLRAATTRRPVRTLAGTLASLLLMGLFFDRMAELYDAAEAA